MSNPALLIFGATGDLAKRKLLPAVFALYRKKRLVNTPIVAIGRRSMTKEEYLEETGFKTLEQKHKPTYDIVRSNLTYLAVNLEEKHPASLASHIKEIDKQYRCNDELVCYLATSHTLFTTILALLKRARLLDKKKTRVAFEKPFGTNKTSAEQLDRALHTQLPESQIYRVDHYLGKSIVSMLETIRFNNPLFANLWKAPLIDHVQIVALENFGIEARGHYYDAEGATRDMVQNHLLQLVALTAMERPKREEAEFLRNEKVNILKKLRMVAPEDIVRGQYESYTQEENVARNSQTETFIAFKTSITTPRWKNIPFYIKTGKALDKKYSEINIVLKAKKGETPNVISIRIGPDQEGIAILAYTKELATHNTLRPITLEYCHKCEFGPNTPEAYESIVHDFIEGDKTIFTRSDELLTSWKFTDNLIKNLQKTPLHVYKPGSRGPLEADRLLNKKGHAWTYFERKITI
ncbi:MAG: glucose-6-phosphate dehydrogenase [Nanoarchaeota archaeon]